MERAIKHGFLPFLVVVLDIVRPLN